MLLGGTRVFVVGDPFVAKIPATVAEGISLLATQKIFGWPTFFNYAGWNLLPLAVAAWLLLRRKNRTRARLPLVFASLVALGFVVLLFSQVRWSFGASGPLLCLLLVVTAAALVGRTARVRWLVVAALVGVFFLPQTVRRISAARTNVAGRHADRMDLQQILYRDAAAALRASQPQGDIVLLASPNGSTGMGYYGQFKTIDTLYWENYTGMRAAAEIFCAPDDQTARALIHARGITHLAMISEENFLPQFFSILHPDRPADDLKLTFGYKLLVNQVLPSWLRPIPYRAPPDVSLPNLRVLLLQVVPDQPDWESLWHIARAQLALGESENAVESFVAAANRTTAENRAPLLQSAGNTCYQNGAHIAAAKLYRLALTLGEYPVITVNLAWLLATSRDDAVRSGAEALALVEPLARAYAGDSSVLSAYAAALAEAGRFADAATVAGQTLELLRAAGNPEVLAELTVRIEAYRASRPWRR
jgi:tetratricopeptide (TPR) repeat protein